MSCVRDHDEAPDSKNNPKKFVITAYNTPSKNINDNSPRCAYYKTFYAILMLQYCKLDAFQCQSFTIWSTIFGHSWELTLSEVVQRAHSTRVDCGLESACSTIYANKQGSRRQ